MSNSILLARIDALNENLSRIQHASRWFDNDMLGLASSDFWQAIEDTVDRELRIKEGELTQLRNAVGAANGNAATLEEHWKRFNEVYEQSQVIFRECLTLIGALTFRGMGLDKKIWSIAVCRVADEVIRACARASLGPWYSVTVPASEEAVTQTLARIIRLRFPEWTIWTLPLAAHEFGHVVAANEDRKLKTTVKAALGGGNQSQHTDEHLEEFIADAVATLTMGPAYASAAIALRLDPVRAYVGDAKRPWEAMRAAVILGILTHMSRESMAGSYDVPVRLLTGQWDSMLTRVHPTARPLAPAVMAPLVDSIWRACREGLRPTVSYPAAVQDDGWSAAIIRATHWRTAITSRDSKASELPPNSKLRDILNAAWHYRLGAPADAERVAKLAYDDCEAILVGGSGGGDLPSPKAFP
jgi:hypothetical protein